MGPSHFRHPHYHRHLSSNKSEIAAHANLLALPRRSLRSTTGAPSVLWLATRERQITTASPPTFPNTLQRPRDIFSRLSMSANRYLHLHLEDVIPECAALCSAHQKLNPWIIGRMYCLVVQEATELSEVGLVEGYHANPGRYHCIGIHGETDGDGVENMKRTRSSNNITRLGGSMVSEMKAFLDPDACVEATFEDGSQQKQQQ